MQDLLQHSPTKHICRTWEGLMCTGQRNISGQGKALDVDSISPSACLCYWQCEVLLRAAHADPHPVVEHLALLEDL